MQNLWKASYTFLSIATSHIFLLLCPDTHKAIFFYVKVIVFYYIFCFSKVMILYVDRHIKPSVPSASLPQI